MVAGGFMQQVHQEVGEGWGEWVALGSGGWRNEGEEEGGGYVGALTRPSHTVGSCFLPYCRTRFVLFFYF